jgi:hypothetical protein
MILGCAACGAQGAADGFRDRRLPFRGYRARLFDNARHMIPLLYDNHVRIFPYDHKPNAFQFHLGTGQARSLANDAAISPPML